MIRSDDYQQVFPNGLPFLDKLRDNIDSLKTRIGNHKPAAILIDGGSGEGKTTLAIEIVEYFQGFQCDFEKQLGKGGENFVNKLKTCYADGLRIVIYDEAGDFSKRGAITRFNRFLIRVFDTYRTYNILVVICLPDFSVLDNQLFDNRIPRLLLHCHHRVKIGNYAAYSLYRMYHIKKLMTKLTVKPQAFSIVYPNFRGNFYNLSKNREEALDKFSTAGKLDILDQAGITLRGLKTMEDIRNSTGKSLHWIQLTMAKLNIKPTKTFKHRGYYTPGDLEFVSNYLENQREKKNESSSIRMKKLMRGKQ